MLFINSYKPPLATKQFILSWNCYQRCWTFFWCLWFQIYTRWLQYGVSRSNQEDLTWQEIWRTTMRKKFPYPELLRSAFSRIRTEYGEILSISPYSVRMRENADQNNSEYGNFSRSYPFIQVSLEWRFSELFSANVSLWSQYKYIAFNIFSCTIVIVLYEMLIITGISNEKTIYSIYEILCRSVTIFYQQELASLFQMQEKLKTCRSLVWTRVVWTFRVAILLQMMAMAP